jgi:hypothetical protein
VWFVSSEELMSERQQARGKSTAFIATLLDSLFHLDNLESRLSS